jgi:plastocyanin
MNNPTARLAALAAVSLLGCLALSASASASVTGYNEPTYTKTNGNNTYWYAWTAVNGLSEDANGNSRTDYRYYLCFNTYRNGIKEEASNGTNGPGSTNCTASFRSISSPTPSSGNNGYYPYGSGTVLQDGHLYQLCASDWWAYVYVWTSGISTCPGTTIDRNKPALGVTLAGGANVTNNPTIPVSISYSDATSPPWAGNNGYASNWICIASGTSCSPGGNPDNNCSAPNGGFNNRNNSFNCGINIATGDGQYAFCTFGADQAIPDNPGGTNQFASATSNNANLSNTACDSVILDRAGPAVTVNASATTVTVGQLVSFTSSVTDPNGLSGGVTWEYGDNTPNGAGPSATHTYTQPGTYVVKARQSDAAGNVGEGTKTITVNPASSGGGGTGGGGTGGGGGGTAVTPGTQTGTSGAGVVSGGTTTGDIAQQVGQQAGGGGSTTTSLGALDVVAPKRFTAGRRTMLLAFTADTGGALNVALLRKAKVVAKKSAALGGPGTYTVKLRVPKKLRAGTHKLKVSFKPEGASKATTKTLKVKVAAKKRKGKVLVGGGELHGTRADRSRKPVAVDPNRVNRTIAVR